MVLIIIATSYLEFVVKKSAAAVVPYSALSTALFDYGLAIYWCKHIGTESFAHKIALLIGPCHFSLKITFLYCD